MSWKLTIALIVIVGVAGGVYLSGVSTSQVKAKLRSLEKAALSKEHPESSSHGPIPMKLKEDESWDGLVTLSADEERELGLQRAKVEEQTQPIRLELAGRTAYDPDTLTKIRPRFDTLVEKVHASLGQTVKKGDPLVELYSTDLAAAKSDYQSKYVQWQHDKNLLDVRADLVKRGAISRKEYVDTLNDEQKSRLDYILAGDKLRVYKVPDAGIAALLTGLGDVTIESHQFGSLEDKAKMTLTSPVDGIVIEREVVPQNFYDTSDVLMVIAPLDHLWVWVNVFELDQDKVKLGQTMEIQFPYLDQTIRGEVQYVASEVSKDTRAVRVRARIENPGARLKSEMLVKAMLEIPPVKGQTVIPRLAMVSSNGNDFVFVRRAADAADSSGLDRGRKAFSKYERKRIEVAQESHDQVVVRGGLVTGQEVVTSGSLILAQMYEDLSTTRSGQQMQ